MASEHVLAGGQTAGLVRIGATTRRPAHDRSGYVDALLRHLADVGFTGAPCALGYDDRGRQILSFVEGQVPGDPPYRLSDAAILGATALIKAFHDATAASPLRGDGEVVRHGDLGPHNTVFRGDTAVALIDFDADTGPGSRLDDVADAVWCFTDLTEPDVDLDERVRKARLMCDAYPADDADRRRAGADRAPPAGSRAARRGRSSRCRAGVRRLPRRTGALRGTPRRWRRRPWPLRTVADAAADLIVRGRPPARHRGRWDSLLAIR